MIPPPRAWALVPRRAPYALHHPSPLRLPTLRRHNATKTDAQHPTAQTAPQTSKTIPGPGWLWLEPIYEPFRAYGRAQQRRPYMTQFVSALVIYFVGDLVAQSIGKLVAGADDTEKVAVAAETSATTEVEEDEERGWVVAWAEDRDWARTARALLIGGAAAVPGYKWFLWLSNSFNYSSKILSLTTKVGVNQLLFTPIFNSYFFGMQYVLTTPLPSLSLHDLTERLVHTVPTSWINSCKIWPVVTAFSFTFIPLQYRSIFGGVIAIGWQTYLSLLNQRAEKEEGIEHELEKELDLVHRGGSPDTKGVAVGYDGKMRERLRADREGEKCAA